MPEQAITLRGVEKSFGEIKALDGVDLHVNKGEILGLLGPNGAGKTTLVRIMTTLMRPDAGTVLISGHDAVTNPDEVRKVQGLAGQYAAVDQNLTGYENLLMVGRLHHMEIAEASRCARLLLDRFNLADAANRTLQTYSGGMRRRLDVAAALVNSPEVLFLDEPTTGLDPQSRLDLWKVIRELVREGTTVLLTTQYLEEADHLADRIVVIDHGKMVAEGAPADLKAVVGGDVLEIHLLEVGQVNDALRALRSLGAREPKVDLVLGSVMLPVENGTGMLPKAVRALDLAHIGIADLQLRRPTLDEAFLRLTGHAVRSESALANLPVYE